jgi:hypothetical protein
MGMSRWPRWGEALDHGSMLRSRCHYLAGDTSQLYRVDDKRETARWALLVYAVAGAAGADVAQVSPSQVRYRLIGGRHQFGSWLCTQLQRMGHNVAYRLGPGSDLYEVSREDTIARIERRVRGLDEAQGGAPSTDDPVEDDPVARLWRQQTKVTVELPCEMSDATMWQDPPDWELHRTQRRVGDLLDRLLIREWGGWPVNTPVRTHGLGPYITATGQLAEQAGIYPDRAVIHSPWWQLDHTNHTLHTPPIGYRLQYRHRDEGVLLGGHVAGPVAVQHLGIDLAGTHDEPAGHCDTTATPSEPVSAGDTAGFTTAVPLESSAPPLADAHTSRTWEQGLIHDPFREGALARLWKLRDQELLLAGDTTPQRLAQRMLAGAVPFPPEPLSSSALDEFDQVGVAEAEARWESLPGTHLVTGQCR